MGSWLLHAAGLLIEELGRVQVEALGRGCRPYPHKINAADPPPNTVIDGHGHCWELGDRARHIDSTSLADNAKKPDAFGGGGARTRVPVKSKIGRVSSEEAGDRMLLLPDHVEARGNIDEPTAICTTDGPPGLPINSQSSGGLTSVLPTATRRGTIRAPLRSVDTKLAQAHHNVTQRRFRSNQSEYFCLMVPCCRVTLGPGTHEHPPATNPLQWPAYVSAVVLGACVHGEILPRGRASVAQQAMMAAAAAKAAAQKKAKRNTMSGGSGERVKWQTESGETVMLDFHNGPVSNGPTGSDSDIYSMLSYLDEHWVRKARRFPATWSLLWVETRDTEMVLSEMRGHGVEDICPGCTGQLIFGSLQDKDLSNDSSNEDSASEDGDGEDGSACRSDRSWPASTLPSDPDVASNGEDSDELPDRPAVEKRMTKKQMQRRATRAVQKLLRSSTCLTAASCDNVARKTAVGMDYAGSRPSSSSMLSDEVRMHHTHNISRASELFSDQSAESRLGSLAPGMAMLPRDTVTGAESPTDKAGPPRLTESFLAHRVMEIEVDIATRPSGIMEGDGPAGDIAAWQSGSLPCARCHTTSEPACHALICPRMDARHSYFLPVCAECREAMEHVFQQRRWQATRSGDNEDLLSLSETPGNQAHASEGSEEMNVFRQRPVQTAASGGGAIKSSSVLTSAQELCVAIELEMHLRIEDVDQSRHGNLLDELRDEIHRVLMVPLRQIFVLQDDSSRKGIFQIGILHPELVPTTEELRERRLLREQPTKKKNKKAKKARKKEASKVASSTRKPGSPDSESDLSDASQDIAERRTEAASIATELGKMWDRLVTIYYGVSGEYRFGSTNAFPLLRTRRRDGSGLTWRSGIVISIAACEEMIQTMHDGKEAGDDNAAGADDSELGDLGELDEEPQPEQRRPSVIGQRRISFSGAAGEAAAARRPSCGRFMKSLAFDGSAGSRSPPPLLGSSSPQTARGGTSNAQKALESDAREVESQLRPAGLQVRYVTPFQNVQTKSDHAKAEQAVQPQVQREWALEAEKLGLLPPRSELKQMHMSFVHYLAWDGNVGKLKQALDSASSKTLNAGDRCGRTPIHLAVARCKVEVVSLFVSAAEPSGLVKLGQADIKGRTPLHYSAYCGDSSIMSFFIGALHQKSLDIMESSTGDTAVLIAARSGHEESLKLLLFAFASPNIANKRGLTPLHVAAAAGTGLCCDLLLRAGAEAEPKDALDRTPWQWASIYKHVNVMDLLVKAGLTSMEDPWNQSAKSKPLSDLPLGKVKARSRWSSTCAGKPATAPDTPKGRRARHVAVSMNETTALPMLPNTPRSTPRAQTAPSSPAKSGGRATVARDSRDPLRDALLEGSGPQDQVKATAPGGWAGNVGSLAVRWRSWAHAGFTPAGSELESANPTREEVAKTCVSLGGFFCTVCWEYVLNGHQHEHLMFERPPRSSKLTKMDDRIQQ